jgi:predicted Fe-Mo cluster-binding NifX family protein
MQSDSGEIVMKVAVVSSDRVHVDGHFGEAERFLIFEINGAEPRLLEERSCLPSASNGNAYAFHPEQLDQILGVLDDCDKVFVTHIGRTPAARLRVQGIEPVVYEGPIGGIKSMF